MQRNEVFQSVIAREKYGDIIIALYHRIMETRYDEIMISLFHDLCKIATFRERVLI